MSADIGNNFCRHFGRGSLGIISASSVGGLQSPPARGGQGRGAAIGRYDHNHLPSPSRATRKVLRTILFSQFWRDVTCFHQHSSTGDGCDPQISTHLSENVRQYRCQAEVRREVCHILLVIQRVAWTAPSPARAWGCVFTRARRGWRARCNISSPRLHIHMHLGSRTVKIQGFFFELAVFLLLRPLCARGPRVLACMLRTSARAGTLRGGQVRLVRDYAKGSPKV